VSKKVVGAGVKKAGKSLKMGRDKKTGGQMAASLRMLWAIQTKPHSVSTFWKPRKWNRLKPRYCLILPNTLSGSIQRGWRRVMPGSESRFSVACRRYTRSLKLTCPYLLGQPFFFLGCGGSQILECFCPPLFLDHFIRQRQHLVPIADRQVMPIHAFQCTGSPVVRLG